MRRAGIVFILFGMFCIPACGKKPPVVQPPPIRIYEPVEVLKPVPVKMTPPAELLAPYAGPLPVFVAPSDPLASIALTEEGARFLRALLAWLQGKDDAWKAWATAP